MHSQITAIVVAFDSAHALPACLSALAKQNVSAIVVDNASLDNSVEVSERFSAMVIKNPLNEGYGRGNSLGVKAATTSLVLIVNPDLVLEEGAVAELMDAAARYPEAAILAPKIIEPSGRVFFQPRSLLAKVLTNPTGKLAPPDGDACVPFVSGACLLVRRNIFEELGGFDENIFLFYEDDDLCRRIMDAGYSIVYVPTAIARHERGGSSAPRAGRTLIARWHQAWSRAYVSHKYGLPCPAWRMVLVNAPKTFLAMLSLRRPLIERYGGSVMGAYDWLRGRTALEQQGLALDEDITSNNTQQHSSRGSSLT